MKIQLPTIAAILFSALLFTHEAAAAIQCYQCHGSSGPADYRPVDAAYRNITSGGFKGNHRNHMGMNATPASCVPCHGAVSANYSTSHRNGSVNISANINSSPATGTYSKGASFAQSGNPSMGTCSNINCHFEAVTPTWGNAAFTSPNDCNKCHGTPPSGGSSGAAGSHAKHDTYYPGAANCAKCHSDHTAETNKFAHATSAGRRNLNISFSTAPNNGSGAYSGPLNDYLPSQSNTFGNCTATYCHSNGNKALGNFSTNSVATWGNTLTCKGCHKGDSASGDAMTSGSHATHVKPGMYSFKCTKCHAATVNGNMAITNTANHVSGKVNIKFDSLTTAINGTYGGQATPYAKDPGSTYGQCNNVYCHSTVQSGSTGTGAPTYRTPTWGGGVGCGGCHDHDGGHAFTGSTMSSGSHTKHLALSFGLSSAVMKCSICHNTGGKTMSAGQGCDSTFCHNATASTHANGLIEIIINPYFGGGTYNGSAAPRAGYSTCSNVSCHYNTTTPVWGTATPINCFGCHPLSAMGGSHAKHISTTLIPTMYNYTANRSTVAEYDFGCSNCHPVSSANHMNGTVNVTLNKSETGRGLLRSKNSATGFGLNGVNSGITGTHNVSVVCAAAYCHSNGNAANLIYATTPDWYGGAFANSDKCANCHGNAPNNGIAGSASHYNNRMLGYTSNSGGHQIGIHAMSIYSSPGGLAKAGTTGRSSHGNATTSTTISCNVCHYETVTTARNDKNPVCVTCHVNGNSVGALFGNQASIADKSKHVNGTADVAFSSINMRSKAQMRQKYYATHAYSSVWKRNGGYKASGAYDSAKAAFNTATMWDSSTKTCSNIACHMGTSVKWSDNNGITECISCHGSL